MERFIVRYIKSSKAPEGELNRVRFYPGVKVVDESPRMLLVESSSETAAALAAALPDWLISAERSYSIPDTRPKVLRGPTER